MFFHNLKYTIKVLFQNKILIFWTFAFPIILGTLFYLAFSDIEKNETFEPIPIAIVQTEELKKSIYDETFQILGDKKNSDRVFQIKYTSKKEASKLLDQDQVKGYFLYDGEPKIVVKASGTHETILKYVVEEIKQSEKIINEVVSNELEKMDKNSFSEGTDQSFLIQEIITKVMNQIQEEEKMEDITDFNLSYTMIEYYTLIAMTCLYGGILGMVAMNSCLANMSSTGKRIAISPSKKWQVLLGSTIASYFIQLLGIFLLFIYTIFVLNVDYGVHLKQIVLLTLVGCLAGLSLGIFISCVFKTNENVKTGIVISVTMLGCFLSGMMGITMKYVVDKNLPLLNRLNPANMITDGFYALYTYDTFHRYYFNVISLLLFAFLLLGISIFSIRRQKYDSI